MNARDFVYPSPEYDAYAERVSGLTDEFVQCMDGGSEAYREYVEVDEVCDLFDAIRAKLGETALTLSLRQAQVQSLIANFQNEIGQRYVQQNADAQEAVDWYDDTI